MSQQGLRSHDDVMTSPVRFTAGICKTHLYICIYKQIINGDTVPLSGFMFFSLPFHNYLHSKQNLFRKNRRMPNRYSSPRNVYINNNFINNHL